jgi:3-phenylpropionate/trans-cinnamate dioxygenase ferredoxin subunit
VARKPVWYRILTTYELEHKTTPDKKPLLLEVEGKKYCLLRLEDNYYVTDEKCPHAGGHLSHGQCDEKGNIICPVHRFRFNPATGKNVSGEGLYLEHYQTEVRFDGLYVAIPKKSWWF